MSGSEQRRRRAIYPLAGPEAAPPHSTALSSVFTPVSQPARSSVETRSLIRLAGRRLGRLGRARKDPCDEVPAVRLTTGRRLPTARPPNNALVVLIIYDLRRYLLSALDTGDDDHDHDNAGPSLNLTRWLDDRTLIRRFDTCVKESRRECPRHITISLIDASYGFLCNDGYEIFMESADCLMELDQRPTVKACHDRTLREIQNANDQAGMRLPEKMNRMCESLNYFAGCVRQPIRQMCGIEAWMVIFRVLRDTTHTLMPGCVFTSNSLPANNDEGEEQSEGGEPLEAFSSSSSLEPTGLLEKQPPIGRANSDSRDEMEINVVNPTGSFEKTFSSSISRHTNASASFRHRSGVFAFIIVALFLLTI
uniref:Uncharacterized protein n=1 Tax=Plectus sambesii TaxID=2011161 RepID=A0A914VNR3_9BILA